MKLFQQPDLGFCQHCWQRCYQLLLVIVLACTTGAAQSGAPKAVFASQGMVASAEALASQVGVDILKAGGNAVDSAVAVGFALAVTFPQAGNLGGGGFMLLRMAAAESSIAIDYREKAPLAATSKMFLDRAGTVDKKRARFSHLSVGVPGTVAGLLLAQKRYGRLPRAAVLAPAIALAENGFRMPAALTESFERRRERFSQWPATMAVTFKPDGSAYPPGALFRQGDLAAVLKRISKQGHAGFYSGKTARLIAADMRRHGGLITMADFAVYQAVVRPVVSGSYRGYQIESMPPPSSGGVHLVQMLNMLSAFPIAEWGHNKLPTIHTMVEVMRRAYADRSEHLGDPDFWSVPLSGLTNPRYAADLIADIDPQLATPSVKIKPGKPAAYESPETTHYSIIDGDGNAVSNTYTLNFGYGTGIVAAGTGIFLNNEMDDFSAKPGSPNAYGLIGGAANAIAAQKRPLSSMTPTLVSRDGQVVLATGSPGGSRIITSVLQMVMNVIDHRMDIAAATQASRFHHQWWPDHIRIEEGLSQEVQAGLRQRGHKLKPTGRIGSVHSVMRTGQGFYGFSDRRRARGKAIGFDG